MVIGPRGLSLRPYLRRLIDRTETLEIRGLAGAGSNAAIAPPIENLYTPLQTRDLPEAADEGGLHGVGSEALQTVLRRSDRVLIEGDPGAGKTTFLRLVACMLARDADGRPCTGSATWTEGHLRLKLDKPPIPILLRLAGLVPLLSERPKPEDGRRLLDLLAVDWTAEEPDQTFDREHWERLLADGGAWLLLDGLDEVADLDLRARFFAIVRDAVASWKAPIIVASRPFQTEKMREIGFLVATVEPFRNQEIETFLAYWTAAVHRQAPDHAEEGVSGRYLERLKEAILTRPPVRALARNPVMLTCLCIVHWNRGDLPDVRSRVYEAVIHWLLDARKELRKKRFGVEPDLAERALSLLALHAMSTAKGKQSILETSTAVGAVRPAFERFFQGEDAVALGRKIREWLLFECESSGVIEELAGDRIRFWHLTFQEHLAALELARGDAESWWAALGGRFTDARWWETAELFVTCLYDLGQPKAVDGLLARFLKPSSPASKTKTAAEAGMLAREAQMVGTIGRLLQPLRICGYRPSQTLEARYQEALRSILTIFEPTGASQVPIEDRIAAAEALGRGGDPRLRPDVDNYLRVRGTEILLGKFPVTVQEYQRFVDARGYEQEEWWPALGWAARKEDRGWTPDEWETQLTTPNRPVVGVSWWEATAYCCWLSEQCGKKVRLPSEAEWEAAATHPDGEYPWGAGKPTPRLANFRDSELRRPTPVGIYPAGAAPGGHLDLAGNVWEWCRDEIEEGQARPLRGGGWWTDASGLRSAGRSWSGPGSRYGGFGFRVSCSPSSTSS